MQGCEICARIYKSDFIVLPVVYGSIKFLFRKVSQNASSGSRAVAPKLGIPKEFLSERILLIGLRSVGVNSDEGETASLYRIRRKGAIRYRISARLS